MADNSLDLRNLADDLEEASKLSGVSVNQIIYGFAEEIKADAQALAPVDTGKLRSNIQITQHTGSVTIGVPDTEVPYAKYQEYGTSGPYEIRAKNKKALAFKVGGKTVFVKKVTHPGVKAQPYIRPAAERFLDKLGPEAAKVGVNLIMGNK